MRKILALCGLVAVVSLLWTGALHASGMRSGDIVSVGKDETIDQSFYAAGKTITIAGTVKGDVYCAGQNIDISGTVEGDILCAGQDVRITGKVVGDVRAAGQTVTLTGAVGQSATLFGQNTSIEKTATVGRDMTVGGQTTYVGGRIARDVVAMGATTTVSGVIGRDARIEADSVHLQNVSKVARNFDYTSEKDAIVDQGAVVGGQTTKHQPQRSERVQPEQSTTGAWASGVLYWFGAVFVASLIMQSLVPRWFKTASDAMHRRVGASFGLGAATLFLTPIGIVVLFITLVGIPWALLLLAAWLFSMFAAFAVATGAIGHWVSDKYKLHWIVGLLLGSLAVALLCALPIIGGLFGFVVMVWGMGAIALAFTGAIRSQRTGKPRKA